MTAYESHIRVLRKQMYIARAHGDFVEERRLYMRIFELQREERDR